MLSPLLQKLQETIANPGFYKHLTPEEQAELFIALFAPKPKLFEKPKVIKGIDGATPVKDKDYLSTETTQKLISELSQKSQKELERIITARLATITPGKDAEITDELVKRIAEMAQAMIVLPDFPTLLTMEPEAIRDGLELLPDGKKLVQEAIEGLPERLEALENRPAQIFNGGGISENKVKKLISESSASSAGTFETVSKNLDASNAVLNYTGDNLTSIEYASGISKTLNYTGENLTSVVLSGATPDGISLTKTLAYTGANLTEVTYS